jgi:tetratricopeptide (TPR) repeat protein
MIDIINTTAWSRPIYFAVTVPGLDDIGVLDNLVLEGLVFKLVPEKTHEIDMEKTRENTWENYRYRGLLTPDGRRDMSVYRDPNTNSLVTNYAAAHIRLAMNYNRMGQYDEAVKNCERAGEIAPVYPPYLSLMGPFYAEAGEYLKAETFLKGLIEREPHVGEHHLHLAYTYEMEGRIEDALAAYRRAAELGPNLLEAYRRLAAQLLRLDRNTEAVEVLERWLTLHPDDKHVQQVVAQLRSDMGGAADEVPSLEDTLPRQTELEYQTVPGREQ